MAKLVVYFFCEKAMIIWTQCDCSGIRIHKSFRPEVAQVSYSSEFLK